MASLLLLKDSSLVSARVVARAVALKRAKAEDVDDVEEDADEEEDDVEEERGEVDGEV